eukprot:INCI16324.1.p2 GENE.INCI16324.1~~INCI16324.1.p2  ORF type:complete len:212 (-),score=30.99 INCI16324.1:320-955(-)
MLRFARIHSVLLRAKLPPLSVLVAGVLLAFDRALCTEWTALSGSCSTDGNVVFSPRFPQNYGYKGQCTFQAKLSGATLIETAYENYDEAATPMYDILPVDSVNGVECVCINDEWEADFNVTLDANLSLGYVGGDRTDKQPPWKMELDFVCRSPCVDINRFGDPCAGECENPWLDRDGLYRGLGLFFSLPCRFVPLGKNPLLLLAWSCAVER